MSAETILVVDDNHQVSDFLVQDVLPSFGYQPLTAYDGRRGLQILRSRPVDLVLLDLQMPDMSGLDFLRKLSDENKRIPTILITAHGSEQVAAEAFRLGVQDYLTKPIDIDLLNNAISRALNESRLLQEKTALAAQLKEQVSWLTVLSKVGQSVTSTIDLDEVLRRIVEAGVQLTQAEEGFLALLDRQNGHLYLRAVKNVDQVKLKNMRLPSTDSLIGAVIRTSRPLRINRPSGPASLKVSTGFLVHSLVHVPLMSRGKPLGVLSVDNPTRKRAFTEKDEMLLSSLADYAAIAIENASLYQQAQQELVERKAAEQKLYHDAFYDTLTGLPNRALFLDRLKHVLERSKREKDFIYAVLFLDLDRFKDINDSFGHTVGDELLVETAHTLEECLRTTDTVARFGGDEFVILLEDIRDIRDVLQTADRIQDRLRSSIHLPKHDILITTSIGIALSATGYKLPEDVLRDADIAMYSAKAKGKARYEIFDPVMRDRILYRLRMETEMRQAIEREEFRVYYQPILSLTNGEIVGVEALLRWQHPKYGLILPGRFIGLAEDTGMISTIGEWVLRSVIRQIRTWQDIGNSRLTVAVNISSQQFRDQDLPVMIQEMTREVGIEPSVIQIEITERAAMQDIHLTARIIKQLKEMGVKSSMDDFGSSFSSLDSLRQLPVSTLKIGQTFISHVSENPKDAAIAKAMIVVAHTLGLNVIAEGVESRQQLIYLKSQQCDQVQGNLISGAIEPGLLTEMISKRSNLLKEITLTRR